jgi:hypothetical protein
MRLQLGLRIARSWCGVGFPLLSLMHNFRPMNTTDALITVSVISNANLTTLAETLVYIGIGSTWEKATKLNKAEHYYTVQ